MKNGRLQGVSTSRKPLALGSRFFLLLAHGRPPSLEFFNLVVER
ncbi:MAG: hypothetical protein WAN22_03420 [Solirubrobacteraceae bacterium]